MYEIIGMIGKVIDKVLLYVGIVAFVLGIAGLITGAVWTSTAWFTVLGVLGYSLFWLVFVIFFLSSKIKKEKSTDIDSIIRDIKRRKEANAN